MQTSINLQEPYTYSTLLLILFLCIILSFSCYLILKKRSKFTNNQKVKIKVIPEKNIKNIPEIKSKYQNELNTIEYKYNSQLIELRKAYQLISEAVRLFVFEVTDITTQNYTLSEIKKMDIPNLYELIKEYYEPEFASKPIGDFKNSINKARRVISEWN